MAAIDNQGPVLLGITTRNRCQILPKAIRSALTQSCPLQVKVVDDCSSDSTSAIGQQFRDVLWERKARSAGYRHIRNELMRLPGYAWYVSLDDDAWFLEGDEVEVAVKYMREHAHVAAVAFDILSPDRPEPCARGPAQPARTFIGCGHVLRLSAAREAGYYVDTPGDYGGEENDLCLRLIDLGYSVVKLPGVHVWHDKAWNRRNWGPLHCSGVCNDLSLAVRRYPFPEVVGLIPYKLFRHLVHGFRNWRLLPFTLKGIGCFMIRLPKISLSRKPIKRSTLRTLAGDFTSRNS